MLGSHGHGSTPRSLAQREDSEISWCFAAYEVNATTNYFLPQSFYVNDIKCSVVLINDVSGEHTAVPAPCTSGHISSSQLTTSPSSAGTC